MRRRLIRSDVADLLPTVREHAGYAWESLGELLGSLGMLLGACVVIPVAKLWLPERSAERTAWEAERRMRRFEDT